MKHERLLPAIQDNYATLAFLIRVAQGRAYLRGGSARPQAAHSHSRGAA